MGKLRFIKDKVDHYLSSWRIWFTSDDLLEDGYSKAGLHLALNRLRKKGMLVSPTKGFHIIVKPEDRAAGSPPPSEFTDLLMRHLEADYYVGCLSAASYYGATHQRPQVWQVVTSKQKRPLQCGTFQFQFLTRGTFPGSAWIAKRNVKSGYLKVSSPELTAFDLVHFMKQSGGLNNVATVLAELFDEIRVKDFSSVATLPYPTAVFQRLGYLLDHLDKGKFTKPLKQVVDRLARNYAPLAPTVKVGSSKNEKWKILVNYEVEPDL